MNRALKALQPAPPGMIYEVTYGLLNKPGGQPVETYQIQQRTIRKAWDLAEFECARWEQELVKQGLKRSHAKAMTFIYPVTLVPFIF